MGGYRAGGRFLVGYGDGGVQDLLRQFLQELVKCKASTPNLLRSGSLAGLLGKFSQPAT